MTSQLARNVALFVGVIVASAALRPAAAGEPDYDSIADKVVNQSLEVQPGEVVFINGTPGQVDLMGALQVAVAKAGGQSVLQLNIPKASKRVVMETPMEHLEQLPTAALIQLRMADVVINVGSVQDPDLFADVPEERLKTLREAGKPLSAAFRTARFRSVSIGQTGGIPTEAFAVSQGADYAALNDMFWRSLGVGSDQLASVGSEVAGRLKPDSAVRLTSEAGTDLSFKIDRLPARINAGRTGDVIQASGPAQVWLPAGEAYACVDTSSASGTLVVPRTTFRGVHVENLRMTFEEGKVIAMSADSNGEILQRFIDASSAEAKALSVVDIGLNPHSQPLSKSEYASWEMGGMVTVALGNNAWAGGDNAAEGGVSFHLKGATLKVGDSEVVSSGKLIVGSR